MKNKSSKYKTDQEIFWASDFGNSYVQRSKDFENRAFTIGTDLLKNKINIKSAIELGSNIGLNLDGLKSIYKNIDLFGVEINNKAYSILKKKHKCQKKSILDFETKKKYDITLICGVLIHINPVYLNSIYKKLYKMSKKYIYLSEYFNPTPVTLKYRGHNEKLYKRDFAKELWNLYPNLKLVDYGFHWKQDPIIKNDCDDNNWFLFEK